MDYDFKQAEKLLSTEFDYINEVRDYNQKKVLQAFGRHFVEKQSNRMHQGIEP